MRLERPDTAAQLPVKRKGDESGRRFIEPDRTRQGGPGSAEFGGNGRASQRGEEPPFGLMLGGMRSFRKGYRRVAWSFASLTGAARDRCGGRA
jgi:hypothetical protein